MLAAGTQASRKILATRAPPACSHSAAEQPAMRARTARKPFTSGPDLATQFLTYPFSACYYYAYSTVVQPHIPHK